MARIAYIDHSYHKKTLSTAFIPELLRKRGHQVDWFWDDAWDAGDAVAWEAVRHYDVIVMFQSYCQPPDRYFRLAHPNVVYIPMLDQFGFWLGAHNNLAGFWEPFQGSKILNFSQSLHHIALSNGLASSAVQFFQPPLEHKSSSGLHGFFWLRREHQIPWQTISTLVGKTTFDSFHVHMAADPGTPSPTAPSEEDIARHNITTSTWFEDKSDLIKVIERANVYFAPRPGEGIGQSFLEAMARGQCIVSPNQGTMNEYITDGINGLLYNHDAPEPLDFSDAHLLGKAAFQTVVKGYDAWSRAEDAVAEFILTPSEEVYRGQYHHPGLSGLSTSWGKDALNVLGRREGPLKSWGRHLERWVRKQRKSLRRKGRLGK